MILGFLSALTQAHLFAVIFRSHANQSIFRQFPMRFTVVPIVLFIGFVSSLWLLVAGVVLSVWWDVYHSSLQTFGLGRIYDAKNGSDPNAGRTLDIWMNHVLYIGPILGGAALIDHVQMTAPVTQKLGFQVTPLRVYSFQNAIYWPLLLGCVGFFIFYVGAYWRLHRKGYRISPHKVALQATTGITTVFCWGFSPFKIAFAAINFFHAFQYFALVWWTEKKTIVPLFHLENRTKGKWLALALFIGVSMGYGYFASSSFMFARWGISLFMVVSLMHFWYDGFIWSVRKKQV